MERVERAGDMAEYDKDPNYALELATRILLSDSQVQMRMDLVATAKEDFPESTPEMKPNERLHLAMVYQPDGTTTLYRNGKPYGKPYRKGAATFPKGRSSVIFGLRHLVLAPKTPDSRMTHIRYPSIGSGDHPSFLSILTRSCLTRIVQSRCLKLWHVASQ